MAQIDESVMQRIRSCAGSVKVPGPGDRVYKDECMYSFAGPESEGGIFLNMQTLQGFGKKFVALDHERTSNVLYYNEVHHRVPLSESELAAQEAVPERFGIGIENGFNAKRSFKIEKEFAIVVFPEQTRIALPNPELPERVLAAVAAIQANEGSGVQDQITAWEEDRRESKYARNLVQKEPWRKISPNPKDWKCDDTGVGENLWLNLSTGHIGSGRQHWDGSGGNGSALRHYEQTGKQYPLVVKLGTITPHGADVYSYADDEDDLVIDPLLKEHLAHWGINMMEMEKTEKTMAELQIDMNVQFAFDRITEGGSALAQVQGPHLVGLTNLGNFCYMSSVLQTLWGIPALSERYVRNMDRIRRSAPPDIANDFLAQFAKLGHAIVTGETDKHAPEGISEDASSEIKAELNAVAPRLFKALVGRNHAEFSYSHQQDACHYFIHLMEVMDRAERANGGRMEAAKDAPPTAALMTFELEYRTQCSVSGAVSYKRNATSVLELNIPLEAAVNQDDVSAYKEREQKRQKLKEEQADAYIGSTGAVSNTQPEAPVIPRVPYEACIDKFAAEEVVTDVFSPAIGAKSNAVRTTRIASFPPYLMVQLRRYYVDEQWRPRKMDVLTPMPEMLDLESLRARGPQPNEVMQPSTDEAATAPQPTADAAIVAQLASAGFSDNACARAALAVKNANAEAAMNWLLSHMEDSDINDPVPGPTPASKGSKEIDPGAVEMLCSMGGFTERQATAALKSCDNNIERAADWLFSRMDNLDAAVAEVEGAAPPEGSAPVKREMLDGQGKYELVAIISHIGSNTACGHYVAHVKKKGKWYIFNDEKIAVSEALPLELGYMYFYRRVDSAWT